MGEAYNGEISFADSLEVFGGGQDDPVSVSIGGCWDLISFIVLFYFNFILLSESASEAQTLTWAPGKQHCMIF